LLKVLTIIITIILMMRSVNSYLLIAILDLEPSGVLYVCHGGAMSVTCSTSADLLHWNVTLLHPSPHRTFERTLSYVGTIRIETPIMTNLTTL
jgi:hypothetical protein